MLRGSPTTINLFALLDACISDHSRSHLSGSHRIAFPDEGVLGVREAEHDVSRRNPALSPSCRTSPYMVSERDHNLYVQELNVVIDGKKYESGTFSCVPIADSHFYWEILGGASRDRTDDLIVANDGIGHH